VSKVIVELGNESAHEIVSVIKALLEANTLLALSTSIGDVTWTSTVFFSYDDALNIYFISNPATKHCQMIEKNPKISGAIYSSVAEWGTEIQGIQLQGYAARVPLRQAIPCGLRYLKRFPIAGQFIPSAELFTTDKISSRLYQITPSLIQIYDEIAFGDDEPIRRIIFP